jgi:DNA-directed RNA polymerase specialized sigma24 family protein
VYFMANPSELIDFERPILPHLNAAYNLARWLLRSDQDAQDVVQDSFLNIASLRICIEALPLEYREGCHA